MSDSSDSSTDEKLKRMFAPPEPEEQNVKARVMGRIVGVKEITEEDFEQIVREGQEERRLVIVEFYGPKCPACRSMVEWYEDLARNHPNQIFCKINVRQFEEIATAARIEFLPTFIFYGDGSEVDREVGINRRSIEAKVNKHKAQVGKKG